MRLRRLASGHWAFRVRYGQDRATRLRVSPDLTEAEARALASAVVDVGTKLHNVPEADAQRCLRAAANGRVQDADTLADELSRTYAVRGARKQITFEDVGRLWASGIIAHKYPDVRGALMDVHDRHRLERLNTVAGHIPIKEFTRAHALRVLDMLPKGLSDSTKYHYSRILQKVLNLAAWPLNIIVGSPLPPGFLPGPPRFEKRSAPDVDPEMQARREQLFAEIMAMKEET